jgi:hypothetical protein
MRSTGGGESLGSDPQPEVIAGLAQGDGPGGAPRSAALSSAESSTEADKQVNAVSEAGAEPTRSDAVTQSKSHDRPYYFKRIKAGWWLVVLCMLLLTFAFFLYPRRAAVYQPRPLFADVALYNATAIRSVEVDVSQGSSTVYFANFSFDFLVSRTRSTPSRPAAQMSRPLPDGVIAEYCTGKVIIKYEKCSYPGGYGIGPVFAQSVPSHSPGAPSNLWTANFDFTL